MNDFKEYKLYLDFLGKKLKRFEEKEKHFLFCKEGCSLCCEIGNYPFSQLEFEYLVEGSLSLPKEVIDVIDKKIFELKEQREKSQEKVFLHECPFLINKPSFIPPAIPISASFASPGPFTTHPITATLISKSNPATRVST